MEIRRRLENNEVSNEEVKEEGQQINSFEFMNMLIADINNKRLNIIGDFNEDLLKYVRDFANNLYFLPEDDCRIVEVIISSHGGEAAVLFSILDILDEIKETWGATIVTIAEGFAESCGAILFLYGDVKECGKHAEVMIHELSYGVHSCLSDHKRELKRSEKMQKKINKIITEHSPITEKQLNKWYKEDGDKFLDYDDLLELGVIEKDKDEDEE